MISIENLHLIAGYSLIVSAVIVFFISGIEMSLSWAIFGSMYISMSDIGESEMSPQTLKSTRHQIRRLFGYIGALGGLALIAYYLTVIL